MGTTAPTIVDEIKSTLHRMKSIADAAEAAGRDFTDDERTQVGELLKELDGLKERQKKANDSAALGDRLKAALDAGEDGTVNGGGDDGEPLDDGAAKSLNESALALARVGLGGGYRQAKSIGQQFTEWQGYKDFLAQFPRGEVPESAKGIHTTPFHIGNAKALLTGASEAAGAGAFVQPMSFAPSAFDLMPFRELTIRDVITVGQTASDLVEYAQLNTMTNAAAATAEATTTANGTKPESTLNWKKVSAPVVTIAHWLPVTKRALSDAGQLRTLIDSFLRSGLLESLENDIVSGDDAAGAGPEFDGILNTTGVQAQAWDTDIFVTLRKALTKVRTVGKARPTAALINPAEDEAIDLARDANERFHGNGPFAVGPSTIWGVPRVVSEAVPAGQAIVGDLRTVVMWDREQASITASDSHANFFVQNLVAVLGELRAALGIIRPSALVVVDLTAL